MNVQAQLLKVVPLPKSLKWLPVHLHIKHDNPIPPGSYLKALNLNPGVTEHFDLVSKASKAAQIIVNHVVPFIDNTIPAQRYTFTVIVSGDNVPSCERDFKVWVREDGALDTTKNIE